MHIKSTKYTVDFDIQCILNQIHSYSGRNVSQFPGVSNYAGILCDYSPNFKFSHHASCLGFQPPAQQSWAYGLLILKMN